MNLEPILQAALEVVDTEGHHAVTVRRLAKRTHYSRSGLHYKIGDIDTLRDELLQVVAADLTSVVLGWEPVNVSDPCWTRGACGRLYDWMVKHPNRFDLVIDARLGGNDICGAVLKRLEAAGVTPSGTNSAAFLTASLRVIREIGSMYDSREAAVEAMTDQTLLTFRTLVS